jgi:hypothetical protein
MKVEVVHGDATALVGDVLALKYAQARYGLDRLVAERLLQAGTSESVMSPKPGGFRLLSAGKEIAAQYVLFVGVESLYSFEYKEIRAFARRVLSSLAGELPKTKRVLMTVHGPGYGLDEAEAFESQLAGLFDAIESGDVPDSLELITIVEQNTGRAKRLAALLEELIPQSAVERSAASWREAAGPVTTERLRAAGYASASKPHVFVAMPFADEMEDVYHYAISNAVNKVGLLCERADLTAFTGDVMAWVRERVKTASLVIADLTGANPNVYLEVGLAWGCGVPTVLLSRSTNDLRFDVRGQRCLVYGKIKDLEEKLTEELGAIARETDRSPNSRLRRTPRHSVAEPPDR